MQKGPLLNLSVLHISVVQDRPNKGAYITFVFSLSFKFLFIPYEKVSQSTTVIFSTLVTSLLVEKSSKIWSKKEGQKLYRPNKCNQELFMGFVNTHPKYTVQNTDQ